MNQNNIVAIVDTLETYHLVQLDHPTWHPTACRGQSESANIANTSSHKLGADCQLSRAKPRLLAAGSQQPAENVFCLVSRSID